jgi:ribokinase
VAVGRHPGGHDEGDAPVTVAVVGSVNVDLVAIGARLPLPGETVPMDRFFEAQGGKGGNQAAAAAALGAPTCLVGAVGDDHRGTAARAELSARGIGLAGLATVPGATGVAMVLVDAVGENSIVIVPGANAAVTPAQVSAALAALGDDEVVVAASLEVPVAAVEAAARAAQDRGWTFVLNPAPAPAEPLPATLLAATSVITPNETELAALGGVNALLAAGVGAVVVTRGAAGCAVHQPGEPPALIPALAVEVVDTTGAGDAFTGALAVALAAGQPLTAAVRWANTAGGIATEGLGARGSLPSAAEVESRLRIR